VIAVRFSKAASHLSAQVLGITFTRPTGTHLGNTKSHAHETIELPIIEVEQWEVITACHATRGPNAAVVLPNKPGNMTAAFEAFIAFSHHLHGNICYKVEIENIGR
jgi:hypothetical protein